MQFLLYKITLVLILSYCFIAAEYIKCGKLKVSRVFNGGHVTELDEFPWIGYILYENHPGIEIYQSTAVLISQRHLLAQAESIFIGSIRPQSIVLGDWKYNNNIIESDCHPNGQCAPPPKVYNIKDIAIHPSYVENKVLYDIAIIHLEQNVEFSDYIQPICLPPPPQLRYGNSVYGQYLTSAGYKNETGMLTKYAAYAIPFKHCRKMTYRIIPSKNFCASYVERNSYVLGSVLMGINIVDGELQNYYLLGQTSYLNPDFSLKFDILLDISKLLNWIITNLSYEL